MTYDNGLSNKHYAIDPPTGDINEIASRINDEDARTIFLKLASERCHGEQILASQLSDILLHNIIDHADGEILCACYRSNIKGDKDRAMNKVLRYAALNIEFLKKAQVDSKEWGKLYFGIMQTAHYALIALNDGRTQLYTVESSRIDAAVTLQRIYVSHGMSTISPVRDVIYNAYGMPERVQFAIAALTNPDQPLERANHIAWEYLQDVKGNSQAVRDVCDTLKPVKTVEEQVAEAMVGTTVVTTTEKSTRIGEVGLEISYEVLMTKSDMEISCRSSSLNEQEAYSNCEKLLRSALTAHFKDKRLEDTLDDSDEEHMGVPVATHVTPKIKTLQEGLDEGVFNADAPPMVDLNKSLKTNMVAAFDDDQLDLGD